MVRGGGTYVGGVRDGSNSIPDFPTRETGIRTASAGDLPSLDRLFGRTYKSSNVGKIFEEISKNPTARMGEGLISLVNITQGIGRNFNGIVYFNDSAINLTYDGERNKVEIHMIYTPKEVNASNRINEFLSYLGGEK